MLSVLEMHIPGAEAAHNVLAGIYEAHPAGVGFGSSKIPHQLAVDVGALGLLAVVAHEDHHSICCRLPYRRYSCSHVSQSHGQEMLIDLQQQCLQFLWFSPCFFQVTVEFAVVKNSRTPFSICSRITHRCHSQPHIPQSHEQQMLIDLQQQCFVHRSCGGVNFAFKVQLTPPVALVYNSSLVSMVTKWSKASMRWWFMGQTSDTTLLHMASTSKERH